MVLAAAVAAATRHIRVGIAGVKLRYAIPLKIAEDVRLLALLFPHRVDFGVISGGEPSPIRDMLLHGRIDDADFAERVDELLPLIIGPRVRENLAYTATPVVDVLPQMWICGLSEETATYAAERGMGFAIHLGIGPDLDTSTGIVRRYRERFRPNAAEAQPTVAVVCFGTCAETAPQALSILRERERLSTLAAPSSSPFDRSGAVRSMSFYGSPTDCLRQFENLAKRFGPCDLVLHCVASSIQVREEQLAMLSDVCDLKSMEAYSRH